MELSDESLDGLKQLEGLTEILSQLRDDLPEPKPTPVEQLMRDQALLSQSQVLCTIGGIQQFLGDLIQERVSSTAHLSFGEFLLDIPWSQPQRTGTPPSHWPLSIGRLVVDFES